MNFDVYQDAGKAERGLASYSFKIDGRESLLWSPTRHAAERVANRLRLGRSAEAFGGMVLPVNGKPPRGKIVSAGEVTVETVKAKSGREKARERRPGFIFELDGKALNEGKPIADEAAARAACVVEAFLTRGKLGRFKEAEAAFKDAHGKAAKVQVIDAPGTPLHRRIVAKDQDGNIWGVGLKEGRDPEFKLWVPAAPK